MNFSDYSKTKQKMQNLTPESQKVLNDFLSSYSGKSEDELISEIIKTAVKNKKEGKLTNADIDDFYNLLKPMLKKEQIEKLERVIKTLKSTN